MNGYYIIQYFEAIDDGLNRSPYHTSLNSQWQRVELPYLWNYFWFISDLWGIKHGGLWREDGLR